MYIIFVLLLFISLYVCAYLNKLLMIVLCSQFLLAVSRRFGDDYLTHIMLPVFSVAVGEDADLAYFPSTSQSKVKGRNLCWYICCPF